MTKPIIAITTGDPAGIGPEIALKSAGDARVRGVCRPLMVGDFGILEFFRARYQLPLALRSITAVEEAEFGNDRRAQSAPRRVSARLAVSGVNPHAGEDGLFGREEIEHVAPAIADAKAEGVDAHGPFGADTMYLDRSFDAYVVMTHDQGHIPAKLLGFDSTAAFTIGTPIFFATVAHGSAADIAGKGVADPGAMIETLVRMANIGKVRPPATSRGN